MHRAEEFPDGKYKGCMICVGFPIPVIVRVLTLLSSTYEHPSYTLFVVMLSLFARFMSHNYNHIWHTPVIVAMVGSTTKQNHHYRSRLNVLIILSI